MLAYNCSPSFNWRKHLDDQTIARFQKELGAMGYTFQFVTLAGWHALNESTFALARGYAERGMSAYVELQQREFALEEEGYTATRHQREVGAGYFDDVMTTLSGRQGRRRWPWPGRPRKPSSSGPAATRRRMRRQVAGPWPPGPAPDASGHGGGRHHRQPKRPRRSRPPRARYARSRCAACPAHRSLARRPDRAGAGPGRTGCRPRRPSGGCRRHPSTGG